jgi:lysophospholipase L1-like esterase
MGDVPTFTRFIAVGDSITEGLWDTYPDGSMRGWADRVADVLAEVGPIEYANLAVRGRTLDRVAQEQVPVALTMVSGPDSLVSFHAGANNILRPGYNPQAVAEQYDACVAALCATGATVVVFTVQESRGRDTRLRREWNRRFGGFNQMVRDVATRHGAIAMDGAQVDVFYDPRLLARDRLHLSTEGHRRVAAAVLARLGLPHDADWADPLPPRSTGQQVARHVSTVAWVVLFLMPWVLRRLTGKSSGDQRHAKYPQLAPWSAVH